MARSFGKNGAFAREELARSARNYRAIARKESVGSARNNGAIARKELARSARNYGAMARKEPAGSARNNGAIARQESARNEMKWLDLHAFLLNFCVTYPYWAV